MDNNTQLQNASQLFAQLENDLHELEVNTFEIEDVLDADQLALSSSSTCCCSIIKLN